MEFFLTTPLAQNDSRVFEQTVIDLAFYNHTVEFLTTRYVKNYMIHSLNAANRHAMLCVHKTMAERVPVPLEASSGTQVAKAMKRFPLSIYAILFYA